LTSWKEPRRNEEKQRDKRMEGKEVERGGGIKWEKDEKN
jgi:hypothetical protein